MAVEYVRADRWDGAADGQLMGVLWANFSEGRCRFVADTIWVPQAGMAEPDPAAVVNHWLTTAADGGNYRVAHCNRDAILGDG